MFDRMNIHIEVPRVDYEKLSSDRLGESSSDIRARVQSARERHLLRFSDSVNIISNSDMRVAEVRQFCKSDESSESLVRAATSCCAHGAVREPVAVVRAGVYTALCHRILKLARTIADLAGRDAIQQAHIAEALQYRPKLMLG